MTAHITEQFLEQNICGKKVYYLQCRKSSMALQPQFREHLHWTSQDLKVRHSEHGIFVELTVHHTSVGEKKDS